MADLCKTFGANVRKIRRAQEVSQEELADRAKIDRSYLTGLEGKAGRNPTLKVVERIASALGVTPSSLLE
ncbi:MAG: helix-turn-helix domain-containing protein [Sphingobium sp.]|jgi:transcriptional regulator with XRE-family HTH domain|nr:helix-turn-helix domain-containing protein [Sphingobium sp.]MCI1755562.1 helix-turn-helix domain-containing protein [Sphingobium sp.]